MWVGEVVDIPVLERAIQRMDATVGDFKFLAMEHGKELVVNTPLCAVSKEFALEDEDGIHLKVVLQFRDLGSFLSEEEEEIDWDEKKILISTRVLNFIGPILEKRRISLNHS